ncbi:hypothetical protein BRADI_3g27821v3 [Brachypodium distachyon]|uniref:Uncharacterized protein n=1 Tax=Brachypodium distachyon TaxID=15368 RepID=A0A2K2CZM4_BRADI|nr:hypothetical protein BRADI_3g27821v3 [Brachypodium distachyon]
MVQHRRGDKGEQRQRSCQEGHAKKGGQAPCSRKKGLSSDRLHERANSFLFDLLMFIDLSSMKMRMPTTTTRRIPM